MVSDDNTMSVSSFASPSTFLLSRCLVERTPRSYVALSRMIITFSGICFAIHLRCDFRNLFLLLPLAEIVALVSTRRIMILL